MPADQARLAPMDGMPPVDHPAWLRLVDKALNGADFERRLTTLTQDGLRIAPLYTRADALPDMPPPGHAPFTRGTAAHQPAGAWDIRQICTESDPARANAVILEDLAGGSGDGF